MSRHVHKITGGDLNGYEVTRCTGITRSRLPLRLAAYWPSSGWGPSRAQFAWSAGLVRGRVNPAGARARMNHNYRSAPLPLTASPQNLK